MRPKYSCKPLILLQLAISSESKPLLAIKTCSQGQEGLLKNFHFLTCTVNGGDFVMFSACSINWKLLVDSSYQNGPKTCTFYPSSMLYEYIDRRICLKPSLQGSNLLAIDKIEMGVTSSPLRRTEKEILRLFRKNLGPFFRFSVQYRHLVKRKLVKIKPIIFHVLDCPGW